MPNNFCRRTGPMRFRDAAPAPAVEGQPRVIEGYFIVFDQPYYIDDYCEEVVDRHAFDGADMSDVRMLINHNDEKVLGRCNESVQTMTFEIDDVGVYARCEVNEQDTDAVSCWARVTRRDVDQASFGFFENAVEYIDLPDGRCRRIIRGVAQLLELSVCTFPAYESTSVSARSADSSRIRREVLEHKKTVLKRRMKHHA